jgi:tRNA threonylcarbamoyl adenosine modification protein (Sua5/YciO/YrdC/YwlC family)
MSAVIQLEEKREDGIHAAIGALRAGELVVCPTDTVYGMAADAFNSSATQTIFRIKGRPRSLPLPVLVSRPRQAWALSSEVPSAAAELAAAFWPGALTLILPSADLDWDLGDARGSIALRIPDHPVLLDLLERLGPIAATSANRSGEPTAATVAEIEEIFGEQIAVYLDGGPASRETGSTIVDLSKGRPVLVREGPIPVAELQGVLKQPLDHP